MKILAGLSALLLGTALLAGAASADPPDWHPGDTRHPAGGHDGPHGDAGHTPPGPGTGAPQNFSRGPHGPNNNGANTNFVRGNHGAFAGTHGNSLRWNHGLNFHDRSVAHFSAQDRSTWTGGHWYHGPRDGRNGWWWYAGGAWFFYNTPVYPYPDYASTDYYADDYYGPNDGGAAPSANGGYYWYYCSNPAGYYPYVQQCRGPWQPVAPTPPNAQQGGYSQGPDANGPDEDEDDQGPPPGYDDRGPPPGAANGPPRAFDNQGPPPGYDDQNGPDDGEDGPAPPPTHY